MVRPWVSRSQGKSSAVSQHHSTDSSASAKLVVGQRRRRSLGTDGRKANAKGCFRELGQEQEEGKLFVASWARWEAQRKGLVDLERRCQDMSRDIQMRNKRQEVFQSAIEGKLRVQGRASERLQDQIVEEIKELQSTKTEEGCKLRRKSMTCGCTKMRKKKQKDCRA